MVSRDRRPQYKISEYLILGGRAIVTVQMSVDREASGSREKKKRLSYTIYSGLTPHRDIPGCVRLVGDGQSCFLSVDLCVDRTAKVADGCLPRHGGLGSSDTTPVPSRGLQAWSPRFHRRRDRGQGEWCACRDNVERASVQVLTRGFRQYLLVTV